MLHQAHMRAKPLRSLPFAAIREGPCYRQAPVRQCTELWSMTSSPHHHLTLSSLPSIALQQHFLCLVVHTSTSTACSRTQRQRRAWRGDVRRTDQQDDRTIYCHNGGRQQEGGRRQRRRGIREHTVAGEPDRAFRPEPTAGRDLSDILTTRHPRQRAQEATMAEHSRITTIMRGSSADHRLRLCRAGRS